MRSRTKHLVGLDIEPNGITAAQVSVDDGEVTVRRTAHARLEDGIVRDGEVVDAEALSAALERLWKEHRGLPRRVRVGVANQKVVTRIVQLPVLSDEKELEAAVRFRAQDEIPMPLDGAVLDWQRLDVIDTPEGPRQRLLLVAARRDMVTRLVGALRDANLRCEGIDLAAFALVRAMHRPEHDAGHTLYLSISGLTNLAVAEGTTCLFTRATGGGLEALAVELAERRGVALDEARTVLLATGLPVASAEEPEPEPEPAPEPHPAPKPERAPLAPVPTPAVRPAATPPETPAATWGDVPDPAARTGIVWGGPAAPADDDVAPLRFTGLSAMDELYDAPEAEAPTTVAGPAEPPAAEAPPAEEPATAEEAPAADPAEEEARAVLLSGVRRIAADVRTSMDFHGAQGADARVRRVVLTGAAVAVPGFAEALSEQLNLEVVPFVVPGAGAEAPSAAVAAGLAVTEAPR